MTQEKTGGAFFRDSALMLGNNMMMFSVTILSGVIVARGLGPEGRGLYAIALLFPSLLAALFSLGMNTASVYFLSTEPEKKPVIAGTVLFYSAAAGAGAALLLAVLSGRVATAFLNGTGSVFVAAAAPLALVFLILESFQCFFMSERDIRAITAMNAIRGVSHFGIVGILFLAGSLSVMPAILSNLTAAAAAAAAGYLSLRAKNFFTPLSFRVSELKRLASFGLRQHIGTAAQLLNYRADIFVAAALLPPYQVGLYSVSVAVSELLWHIPNAAAQVLYPKAASASKEEADRFTPEVARHVFLLSLLPAAVVWAAAAPLIGLLFGREFLPAAEPVRLLLPGAVLLSVSKVLGSHLSARGFPQHNSSASVTSLLVSVLLCMALIPAYGLKGAAAATSASYASNFLVMLFFFRRISGVPIGGLFLPRRGDLRYYADLARKALK